MGHIIKTDWLIQNWQIIKFIMNNYLLYINLSKSNDHILNTVWSVTINIPILKTMKNPYKRRIPWKNLSWSVLFSFHASGCWHNRYRCIRGIPIILRIMGNQLFWSVRASITGQSSTWILILSFICRQSTNWKIAESYRGSWVVKR